MNFYCFAVVMQSLFILRCNSVSIFITCSLLMPDWLLCSSYFDACLFVFCLFWDTWHALCWNDILNYFQGSIICFNLIKIHKLWLDHFWIRDSFSSCISFVISKNIFLIFLEVCELSERFVSWQLYPWICGIQLMNLNAVSKSFW
jgi:hypothetical protein